MPSDTGVERPVLVGEVSDETLLKCDVHNHFPTLLLPLAAPQVWQHLPQCLCRSCQPLCCCCLCWRQVRRCCRDRPAVDGDGRIQRMDLSGCRQPGCAIGETQR